VTPSGARSVRSRRSFTSSFVSWSANGVASAPRFHGLDESGREIVDFREGWVPPDLEGRSWSDDQLAAAALIVRGLHDATTGSALAGTAEVVCHADLSPCNFVFVEDEPRFLIDFDRARPGTRRSDLAYMAWAWLIGVEDEPPTPPLAVRLRQLRHLLDIYGLHERSEFATAIEDEQREVQHVQEQRGDTDAASWVRQEIVFVQRHAQEIDTAAGGPL
jgi:hypothetical protein